MGIVSYPSAKATEIAEDEAARTRIANRRRQDGGSDTTTSEIIITQTIFRPSSTWTTVATLHRNFPSEPPARSASLVTGDQLSGIIGGVAALIVVLIFGCFCYTSRPKGDASQRSSSRASSLSSKRRRHRPDWPTPGPPFPQPTSSPGRGPDTAAGQNSHSWHGRPPSTPSEGVVDPPHSQRVQPDSVQPSDHGLAVGEQDGIPHPAPRPTRQPVAPHHGPLADPESTGLPTRRPTIVTASPTRQSAVLHHDPPADPESTRPPTRRPTVVTVSPTRPPKPSAASGAQQSPRDPASSANYSFSGSRHSTTWPKPQGPPRTKTISSKARPPRYQSMGSKSNHLGQEPPQPSRRGTWEAQVHMTDNEVVPPPAPNIRFTARSRRRAPPFTIPLFPSLVRSAVKKHPKETPK